MKDTATDCCHFLKTAASITVFSAIIGLGMSMQAQAQAIPATETSPRLEQLSQFGHIHNSKGEIEASRLQHAEGKEKPIVVRGACTKHSSALTLKSLSSWVAAIRG